MSKENKSKNFGNFWKKTALIGALTLPFFFSSPKISAQTNKDTKTQGKNYIYSHDKKITAAGDGVFGKTFVQNLPLTPKSKISLDSLFYAKQGNVYFDVIRAKKGISNIKNYIVSQGNLTGKEKAFKTHLNSLENFIEKNPSDTKTVELLNNALKDETLSVKEDSLYNPKTGEWNIKGGPYIIIARSKEKNNLKSQTIPIFTNVSTHYEKTPVVDRKGIESTLYGHNKNNEEQEGKTFIKYDVNPKEQDEKEKTKEEYNPVRFDFGGGFRMDTRTGNLTNKFGNLSGNASLQFDVSGGKGNVWVGPYVSFSPNSEKIDSDETDLESEKKLVNRSEHGDTYMNTDSSYVTTTTSSQPLTLGGKASFELGKKGTSELELMLGATKTMVSKKIEGEKHVQYSKDGDIFSEHTLTGSDKNKFNKWTGTIGAGFKQYLTDSKSVSINANAGYNFPLESANSTFKNNFYGEVGVGINLGGKK